jgi:hypothetical protein
MEQQQESTTEKQNNVESLVLDQTVQETESSDLVSQETSVQEESVVSVPVSFDNIDPTKLNFSLKYQCAKSTVGQVVQGFNHLSHYLSGTNEYDGKQKHATNKFQEFLYPRMAELCTLVVSEYVAKFITDVDDDLQKQVFGANLNGIKNDGQLNKFIAARGINNKFLRYEFAQFGQLLSLLHYRLNFISMRDPMTIKRYVENPEELKQFENLRSRTREFCERVRGTENSFVTQWEAVVSEARKENGKEDPKLVLSNLAEGGVPKRIFIQKRKYTGPRQYDQEFTEPRQHVGPKQHTGPREPKQYTGPREPRQHAGPREPKQYTGPREPRQHTGPREPRQHTGPREPRQHTGPREQWNYVRTTRKPHQFTVSTHEIVTDGVTEDQSTFTRPRYSVRGRGSFSRGNVPSESRMSFQGRM